MYPMFNYIVIYFFFALQTTYLEGCLEAIILAELEKSIGLWLIIAAPPLNLKFFEVSQVRLFFAIILWLKQEELSFCRCFMQSLSKLAKFCHCFQVALNQNCW